MGTSRAAYDRARVEIPANVRRQATHPFREVLLPVGWERVERGNVLVCLHPLPIAKIVEPLDLAPTEVESAVEDARALIRERDGSLLVWWVASEHESIGEQLERLGLVNTDTPGFERVENAMALVEAPAGEAPEGVVVTEVESLEEFAASNRLSADVFEMTEAMRDEMEAKLQEQYDEYLTPGNTARQFNASIDNRVVGTAAAVRGPAGVNLFGGSVLPEARGRGVYRALMQARWKFAVEHDTPALTVQAGQMAKPIAERLGFVLVEPVRMYVDDLSRA
jgi:GNAT superfamily N-acetyltransferase